MKQSNQNFMQRCYSAIFTSLLLGLGIATCVPTTVQAHGYSFMRSTVAATAALGGLALLVRYGWASGQERRINKVVDEWHKQSKWIHNFVGQNAKPTEPESEQQKVERYSQIAYELLRHLRTSYAGRDSRVVMLTSTGLTHDAYNTNVEQLLEKLQEHKEFLEKRMHEMEHVVGDQQLSQIQSFEDKKARIMQIIEGENAPLPEWFKRFKTMFTRWALQPNKLKALNALPAVYDQVEHMRYLIEAIGNIRKFYVDNNSSYRALITYLAKIKTAEEQSGKIDSKSMLVNALENDISTQPDIKKYAQKIQAIRDKLTARTDNMTFILDNVRARIYELLTDVHNDILDATGKTVSHAESDSTECKRPDDLN